MQHLEAVSRSRINANFNVLLKNILYGRFQTQDQSVSAVLGHKNVVYQRARASKAQAFIEQLDLVRQFMYPAVNEFVSMYAYLVDVCHQLVEENWRRGYFNQGPSMGKIHLNNAVEERANKETEWVKRLYQTDLDQTIRPNARYSKNAGLQAADILRQYIQAYEIKSEHMEQLMQEGGCMDQLLVVMCDMDHTRQQEGGEDYAHNRVDANYELFVRDLTGVREAEAGVVIDNDSLSVVDRRLVLNPQIGMGGKRRNKAGQLDPYIAWRTL